MDFLQATRDIKHFIFLGGCSGALISLEIACSDPRVIGAVLINFPIAGDEDGQPNSDLHIRRAAHYYRHYALFDLKSWRNLLTGKTSYRNLSRVLRFQAKRLFLSEKKMSPQMPQFQVSLRRLIDRGVCLIFLCSEGDPLLDDLRQAGGDQLRQLCTLGKAALEIVPRSDHTFSSLDDQERLLASILERINAISSTEHKLMNCA
jgi:hypothetical protein